MTTLRRLAIAVLAPVLAVWLLACGAAAADEPDEAGPTPPRLSLIEAQVFFWRPGNEDWTTALLNTPLAAGDALYAGENARFEVQFGRRAFIRGGQMTQLVLLRLDEGRLHFRLSAGQAVLDLNDLPDGLTIEVETPNSRVAIERSGYYRLNADQDTTFFGVRRDGRATAGPLDGTASELEAGEEMVIEGRDAASLGIYPIGEADAWDRWNEERSRRFAEADSAPDLSPDIYGAEALASHGRWQPEPEYGAVWIPAGMAADWAPYSSGQWMPDPFYGWTWIDHAPWGWAPFHYGRWVFIRGVWAWAPGPRTLRSVYSPALVGFVGFRHAPHGHKTQPLGWVALSWGEPLRPWWGRRGFVGRPWWGGWHGPRVVDSGGFDHAGHHYRNTQFGHALVAVPPERFGHGPVQRTRIGVVSPGDLTPVAGSLPAPVAPHRWAVGRVGPIPPRNSSGMVGQGPVANDFKGAYRPVAPPLAASPAVAMQAPAVAQAVAPTSSEIKVLVPSAPNVVKPVITTAPPLLQMAPPRFAQPRPHANTPHERRHWPSSRSGSPRDHGRGELHGSSPAPAGGLDGTITPRRFAVRPMSPPAGAVMAPIQPITPVAPIAPIAPLVSPGPFVAPPASSSVLPSSPSHSGRWHDGDRRGHGGRDGESAQTTGSGASHGGSSGAFGKSSSSGRSWREGGMGRR